MLFFQQKIRGKWPNICHGNPGWFGQKIRQATMELTTLCLFPSNPFGKIATLPTRWVPTISYRLGVITFGAPINGRKSMGFHSGYFFHPGKTRGVILSLLKIKDHLKDRLLKLLMNFSPLLETASFVWKGHESNRAYCLLITFVGFLRGGVQGEGV